MPQNYTPVADCPWVKVAEKIREKLLDQTLAFYKFCVAVFGKVPQVFARFGTDNNAAYWEPPLTECPAVLVTAVNTPPGDDYGAGNEQWHLSFAITAKYELADRDQRKALAANFDLLRTLFYRFRPGTLDILTGVPGVGKYEIVGDLTPQIAQAGAQTTARTTFIVQFTLFDAIFGG